MKRALVNVFSVVALLLLGTPPSWAYEPVTIVHTERVEAGPYGITVGFSRWPVRAMQSLDFTFAPDGGREGKSGVVEASPDGVTGEQWPLARHPRKPEVWGLDIQALGTDGQWTFRFTVDGPDGQGVGELTGITVLAQPGPPLALSWAVTGIPLAALIGFLVIAWRRVRIPEQQLAAV